MKTIIRAKKPMEARTNRISGIGLVGWFGEKRSG
jgi:hypothetical protein